MTRQLDAIDDLLQRGANINARRMDGARPIHLTNGDYFYRGWRDVPRFWPVTAAKVMEHLKARGAHIDLPTACHTGDIARVRELLQQDPGLANTIGDHEGYYLGAGAPLSNAAAVGRMDIVQLLLEHGADPNLREEQYAPKGKALYSPYTTGITRLRSCCSSAGRFQTRPSKARATRSGFRGNGALTSTWNSCCCRTAQNLSRNAHPRNGPRANTTGCALRRFITQRERAT